MMDRFIIQEIRLFVKQMIQRIQKSRFCHGFLSGAESTFWGSERIFGAGITIDAAIDVVFPVGQTEDVRQFLFR